jgi:hypothetical protein
MSRRALQGYPRSAGSSPMPAHVIPADHVQRSILSIRGHRVMLDTALAEMYDVEVRVLNQAVKRNQARFPVDFAFRLTEEDVENLKSQSVISSERTHGGARRALPMVFRARARTT